MPRLAFAWLVIDVKLVCQMRLCVIDGVEPIVVLAGNGDTWLQQLKRILRLLKTIGRHLMYCFLCIVF